MEDQINFYEMKLRFETDSWDLFEELNSSKNVIVIDARSPEAFAKEHIPGAVNMPHRTMSEETTSHFDKAKSTSPTAMALAAMLRRRVR